MTNIKPLDPTIISGANLNLISEDTAVNVVFLRGLESKDKGLDEPAQRLPVVGQLPRHLHHHPICQRLVRVNLDIRVITRKIT